jgi:hypothetical protein
LRVRLAVVGSIVVHGAVIAAAYRLPKPQHSQHAVVEFEIRKREVPVLAPLTPPMPAPEQPKVASVEPRRRSEASAPQVRAVPLQPMETAPKSSTPEELSPQATVPERKGPVDLTLHGLPSTGEWAKGPTAPPPPRPTGPPPDKAYKLRGDVGDPILGKMVEKKDDYPLEYLGRDGYLYKGPQFSAHIAMDGSVSFDDKIVRDFKGLSGGFDVTDWVMKGKKQDPYRYEKEKFMKYTQKKRDELAKKAREADIENSIAQLPATCDDIWHEPYKKASQKRRALYELWRDVEDTDAGARAREIIEAYVRRHLPQGTPDAFTEEELALYNSKGGRKFEPYR